MSRPSMTAIPADDFLYHLYRGTELLEGDHVHEAKEELESALALSPQDPKSQDLLGVVYFRLGMYPRAIQIFTALVREHPQQRTPKINLALCYLKTAQQLEARSLLEQVVATHPNDARAWGYLGLVHERLGDLEKAREAYLRGGHASKARRLDDGSSGPRSVMDPLSQIRGELASLPPIEGPISAPPTRLPPPSGVPTDGEAPSAAEVVRAMAVVPPRERGATQLDGWVSVSIGKRFACRLDAVRSATGPGGWDATPLGRRAKGAPSDEPLGGRDFPVMSLRGADAVMLGPRPGFRLTALRLAGGTLVVREDILLAMGDAEYESARIGVGGGEGVVVVRLRGEGFVVVETPGPVVSTELLGAAGLFRADVLLGFLGELEPRYLAESEAPGRTRGLIEVRGNGFVLLDGR